MLFIFSVSKKYQSITLFIISHCNEIFHTETLQDHFELHYNKNLKNDRIQRIVKYVVEEVAMFESRIKWGGNFLVVLCNTFKQSSHLKLNLSKETIYFQVSFFCSHAILSLFHFFIFLIAVILFTNSYSNIHYQETSFSYF